MQLEIYILGRKALFPVLEIIPRLMILEMGLFNPVQGLGRWEMVRRDSTAPRSITEELIFSSQSPLMSSTDPKITT